MHEEGMLSIVRAASHYQIRYASTNYRTPDRRPYTCPDEAHLAAFLHACGLDRWSIHQTGAELRQGRVAVMPIAIAPAQREATFPLPCAGDAPAVAHASV